MLKLLLLRRWVLCCLVLGLRCSQLLVFLCQPQKLCLLLLLLLLERLQRVR